MRYLSFLALTVLGCSSEVMPPSSVVLLTGQEGDIWSSSPPPTNIQVDIVEADRRTAIGRATAPASEITIQDPGLPYGTIASFEATGVDPNGTAAVHGVTIPYLLSPFRGIVMPIFVGRTGAWSRPPSSFEHPHFRPAVAVAFHRYVLAAGGDAIAGQNAAVPDVYNMGIWTTLRRQPPFPRAPKSMAVVGALLLSLNDQGGTWLDLTYEDFDAASAPDGLSFSEVAGGDTFELSDGTLYIVGATRSTGEPTAKVLRIDKGAAASFPPTSSALRVLSLSTPRLGAAAAVIGGNLVVVGGSADGPGVEVLTPGQMTFTPLSFAPDASAGHGLVWVEGTIAMMAGGKDAVTGAASSLRTFDATCAADCATTEVGTLPLALQRTRAFSVAAGTVLVVGESEEGLNHAFSVAMSAGLPEIVERPLREPRKWGAAMLLPNSLVGILGGAKPDSEEPILSIESFQP